MACNDEKAIEKVKGELEDEGLTPDEAARLIQSVFRKVRASKPISIYFWFLRYDFSNR